MSDEQLRLGQLSRDAERNRERINQRNKSLQKLIADLGLVGMLCFYNTPCNRLKQFGITFVMYCISLWSKEPQQTFQ